LSSVASPPATAPAEAPPGDLQKEIPRIGVPGWVQTAQFVARPDRFLERNWARYGDVFRGRIYGFGTGKNVFLADPEMIKQVFRASPHALRLGEIAGIPVVPMAGPNSLLALDAPKHLEHRKIVNPPLHGERLQAYEQIMVEAADRSLGGWPIDKPFPLRPRFADITMEVMMRAIFGVEGGSRREELSTAVRQLIEPEKLLGNLALTFPKLRRDFGPLRHWSTFERHRARADALIYDEIASRRQAEDLAEREDILSMLLATSLTDEEIHDELITMMIAGHETTATALAWTFDLLLHHPSVLDRLRDELNGGDEEYLEAVVHEALRVRPVVATPQRVVREPVKIGGFELEPGITVFSAIWLVHRRRDLYPPDPYAFRPERFLGLRPPTYEWIPFGGGVRRCIGANFAPMEMKVVLRRIITQAHLEPGRPELERPQNKVVLLAPRHGTMAIRRR